MYKILDAEKAASANVFLMDVEALCGSKALPAGAVRDR